MSEATIYDFRVKSSTGHLVSLNKYKGLVVIVVNVASFCGFTHSNYTELKVLIEKYHDRGLRVAAFPCNQFGFQEPHCESDVETYVETKFHFLPDLYGKVLVNSVPLIGEEDPFWTFLKKEQGGTYFDAIKWNFTKFLVNRKGKVVARYGPSTNPESLEEEIVQLLNEKP